MDFWNKVDSNAPGFITDSLGRTRPKKYAVAPRTKEHWMCAMRFVFTIEGWSELVEEKVTNFLNSVDCELGVYAREGGRNMIHPHYQGYIELRKGEDGCTWNHAPKGQTVMNHILGELKVPFHVERAKSTSSTCINYVYAINCHKDYEIGDIVAKSGTFLEPSQWLANAWVRNFYLSLQDNFRPFQRELHERIILDSEGGDNLWAIHWVYDASGNTGKSIFIKWLHLKYGAIVTGGTASDMKHAAAWFREVTGFYPAVLCVDVARSDKFTTTSAKALEALKNGMFFSGKYESGMTNTWTEPIVIVFANRAPDWSAFSADRWRVYGINNRYELVAKKHWNSL